MSDDWTKEIKERLVSATPGPWKRGCVSQHVLGKATDSHDPLQREFDEVIEIIHAVGPGHSIEQDDDAYSKVVEDSNFIANAPTDIANLLKERDVLREALTSYAADAFDSATSLGDYDFMGYGAIARKALAYHPTKEKE